MKAHDKSPLNSSLLVKPVSADWNLDSDYCFYLEKVALYPHTKRHKMPDNVGFAEIIRWIEWANPMIFRYDKELSFTELTG